MNTLFSLKRLTYVTATFLLFAGIARGQTTDRATLKLSASVDKAFAVNLPKYTGKAGTYSFISAPNWLQLNDEGILFGTPSEKEIGDHETFISAKSFSTESLFHVVVSVLPTMAVSSYQFEGVVDQVFKVDLSLISKKSGKYTFTDLPKWLQGLESGILVGMPKKENLGTFLIKVSVVTATATEQFTVTVQIRAPATGGSSNPISAYVGKPFRIHVTQIAKMPGDHFVTYPPHWLRQNPDGYIVGTPSYYDQGMHSIYVKVIQGNQTVWVRASIDVSMLVY